MRRRARISGAAILSAAGGVALESVRRHRAMAILIVGYALASRAAAHAAGASGIVDNFYLYDVFAIVLAAAAIAMVLFSIGFTMLARPADSLYAAIGRDLAGRLNRERLVTLLAPMLLAPLFFSTFSSFKTLIPYLAPFAWDEAFLHWDRWLHGGTDPWRLLQPVLGGTVPTQIIDALYYGWIPAMLGVFWWQAGSTKRGALRMRFLLSFLLCWILIGTVLATALSSAGPCYFGRVTGLPDPFAPLIANLRQIAADVPLFALSTQDMLWQAYQNRATTVGGGISAMPSMHVAIAVLMALFGWQIGRRTGVLFTGFAVLTMLGSVHLGWHYAIDGYVSAVAAAAIWWSVGRALRRAKAAPAIEAEARAYSRASPRGMRSGIAATPASAPEAARRCCLGTVCAHLRPLLSSTPNPRRLLAARGYMSLSRAKDMMLALWRVCFKFPLSRLRCAFAWPKHCDREKDKKRKRRTRRQDDGQGRGRLKRQNACE